MEQVPEYAVVHSAENIQHMLIGQCLAEMERRALVQETQCVSHGAVSGFCHIAERFVLHRHVFRFRKFF